MKQGYIVLNEILYNFLKKNKKFKKDKVKGDPIQFIIQVNLPNNNFMNSITTSYVINFINFTAIPMYFWKSTDDVNLNLAIKNVLKNQNTTALDWPDNYKNQAVNAANNFYDLVGFQNIVVDKYSNGAIICVLGKQFDFYGAAYGPYYVYFAPVYYDNRIILFINNATATNRNMAFNGFMYYILLQQFGRCFGLVSPEEQIGGSIVMPGMLPVLPPSFKRLYETSLGYENQNTVFNTVMSNNNVNFYLPCDLNITDYSIGYPSNLQPLDLASIRWLYQIQQYPETYPEKYSVKTINPTFSNLIKCIIGPARSITFGENTRFVNFYINNYDAEQIINNYNNIFPYSYNRDITKQYGFYNMDIDGSIASVTFNNGILTSLFIGYNGTKINLVVNINCPETVIYFNQNSTDFAFEKNLVYNTVNETLITLVYTVYNKVTLWFNDIVLNV